MFAPRCLLFAVCVLGFAVPATAQRRAASAAPAALLDPSLYNALEWREIGPFRGGRVTAGAGPADQPLTYYFRGAGGGGWETTPGRPPWAPISGQRLRPRPVRRIAGAPPPPQPNYPRPRACGLP